MPTVGTAFGRRVPPVDLDEGAPIPAGFVFQLAHELAPSDIADTLRQGVVLDQILDGQTLDADHLVLADDAGREFVLVIASAVGDTGMDPGHFETCPGSVLTPFLLFRQPPLRFRQLLLVIGKITRISDGLSCRKHYHACEAQIKSDHLFHHGKRLDLFLDQDGDKVAVGPVTGDGHGRRFAAPREWSAPPDSERLLYLSQTQMHAIPTEGRDGIFSGLFQVFLFEDGVVRPALEEVAEGALKMPQRLLRRYAGDLLQPLVLCPLFEDAEQSRGLAVADALVLLVVGVAAQAQEVVVHETHAAKGTRQYARLLVRWIKAIPIGSFLVPLHTLGILLHCLKNGSAPTERRAVFLLVP